MMSRSASRQAHAYGAEGPDGERTGLASRDLDRTDDGRAPRAGDAVELSRAERSDEQIGRILQSLDKLGARIKSLSADAPPPPSRPAAPAVPGPADAMTERLPPAPERDRPQRPNPSLELQRAVEQIVRKRDAIERSAANADPAAASRPARAPAEAARPAEPTRPSDPSRERTARDAEPAEDAAVGALREEVRAIRRAMSGLATAAPLARLETLYDGIVGRLDAMRDQVGDPRVLADLIESLADVRRSLADAPSAAQLNAVTAQVDALGARVEAIARSGFGDAALEELELHLARLATAVVDLDVRGVVAAVETRLADVADRIEALEARLPDGALVAELARSVDRQGTTLAQVQQKADQIPRVAFAVERQSAAFEEMAETLALLPRLSGDVADLKRAVEDGGARSAGDTTAIVARVDEIARRLDETGPSLEPALVAGLAERLDEIAAHLTRLDGGPDAAVLGQVEHRLADLADTLDQRLAAIGSDVDARLARHVETAVGRIEREIARAGDGDRLAAIEAAIARLADGLGAGPIADVETLSSEIARLRDELATLPTPSLVGVEAEIRALANRVDALARPSADARAFEQLEARLAEVIGRLDDRPAGFAAMADALERIEASLARSLEAPAATAARSADDLDAVRQMADVLGDLKADLGGFLSEIHQAGRRDRDFLLSMNATLERLVATGRLQEMPAAGREAEPAVSSRGSEIPVSGRGSDVPVFATPVPTFDAALGAVARDHGAEPAQAPLAEARSWDEIERTLSETLARRGRRPDPVDETPARPLAGSPRAAGPTLDADTDEPPAPGIDDDRPLEPGSGKPSAQTRAPGAGEAPKADAAKSEPTKADFIAAARRAAQAAATVKPDAPVAAVRPGARLRVGTGSAAGLFGVLKRHRRTLLIAAAGVAIAALGARFALGVLGGSPEPAAEVSGLSAPAEPADTASTLGPEARADLEEIAAGAADPSTADPTASGAAAPAPVPPAAMPDAVAVQPQPLGPAGSFDKPAAAAAPAAAALPAAGSDAAVPASTPASTTVPMPPEAVGSLPLRQAAASGNPVAQFEVAARYTEGRGVAQDLAEAAVWYERAALAGLAPAQYRLGSLYEKGQGVARDVKLAEAWYRRAADAGNAKAMHNLAVLNAEGGLGAADYEVAVRWFEAAAEFGIRDSQYNLGILYARGLGVTRDLTASYKWFAVAAAAGDADAAKKRDDVAQVLDKDSLARARLAVETWAAKTPDPAANEIRIEDASWSAVPENTAALAPADDPVATAQRLLAARGYNAGPADGKMGQRTRDAVAAFQAARGLPATGEVDTALLKALAEQEI
ncbi:peptidoglycan-binding protein [Chthonobacter rhizosphaerae]|uniref:peptidoglycan-binding protein n=1 Tax=Chthonobacter rhizosphaerae TaxID=2735553 RepID=UPI0015EF5B3B|nr:peptidoglycan-binding protein [Chthonobacter rhizosphaerae]